MRYREFTFRLSASGPAPFTSRAREKLFNEKGRGRPRPSLNREVGCCSTATRLDVARGAGLVVPDIRGRVRVDDAVAAGGRDRDLDVLDPGVVRPLQLRERDADVAGRMVGVVRLHAGNGGADVRLRSRLLGAAAEA